MESVSSVPHSAGHCVPSQIVGDEHVPQPCACLAPRPSAAEVLYWAQAGGAGMRNPLGRMSGGPVGSSGSPGAQVFARRMASYPRAHRALYHLNL